MWEKMLKLEKKEKDEQTVNLVLNTTNCVLQRVGLPSSVAVCPVCPSVVKWMKGTMSTPEEDMISDQCALPGVLPGAALVVTFTHEPPPPDLGQTLQSAHS